MNDLFAVLELISQATAPDRRSGRVPNFLHYTGKDLNERAAHAIGGGNVIAAGPAARFVLNGRVAEVDVEGDRRVASGTKD